MSRRAGGVRTAHLSRSSHTGSISGSLSTMLQRCQACIGMRSRPAQLARSSAVHPTAAARQEVSSAMLR